MRKYARLAGVRCMLLFYPPTDARGAEQASRLVRLSRLAERARRGRAGSIDVAYIAQGVTCVCWQTTGTCVQKAIEQFASEYACRSRLASRAAPVPGRSHRTVFGGTDFCTHGGTWVQWSAQVAQ